MAQSRPKLSERVESITDVMHELDLLFPNGYEAVSTGEEAIELRKRKIQELRKDNGTLLKVGLSSVKHLEV